LRGVNVSKWLRFFFLSGLLAWLLPTIFVHLPLVAAQSTPPTLSAPRLLAPANDSEWFTPSLTFEWEAVPGADGYLFELQDESTREILLRETLAPANACSGEVCSVTIDRPEIGRGVYRWHVAAQIEQERMWSEWRSFTWYPLFSYAGYHAQRAWLLPLLAVALFWYLERRVIPHKAKRQA
jgi:hypothetical protein